MSTQVILNKFDGGHAEDLRTTNTDECEKSLNFDLFINPHKLIPYGDSIAETITGATMDDIEIDSVDIALVGSDYAFVGTGYESAGSSKINFLTKSSLVDVSGATPFVSNAISGGGTYQKGSLVVYKNLAVALLYNGSGTYIAYSLTASGTATNIGSFSTSSTFRARPFVHPEDNILYFAVGNVIAKWDGTTFTSYTTILPSGYEVSSLTDYGSYLAIAMRPVRGTGNSVVYLWGRDGTLNTLQSVIDFGEGDLLMIENLNNNIIGIMASQNTFNTNLSRKLVVKGYSGGAVETLKSLMLSSLVNTTVYKVKNGGKLYFGLGNDDCVYAVGKNKAGTYIITKDRYMNNGTTIGSGFSGLSIVGDILWSAFNALGGTYTLMRSKISLLSQESVTYTSTSTYRTTINPSMPVLDRYKEKQLVCVRVAYTGALSGATVLKVSVDGGSFSTAISDTNAAGEHTIESNAMDDGTPLPTGREFQFQLESTGGAQIKEIQYVYNVLPTLE